MDKEALFNLYGKVIKGDNKAKKEFILYYQKALPNGFFTIYQHYSKENLHTMYLHLYR